jgi:hypothetical protein
VRPLTRLRTRKMPWLGRVLSHESQHLQSLLLSAFSYSVCISFTPSVLRLQAQMQQMQIHQQM